MTFEMNTNVQDTNYWEVIAVMKTKLFSVSSIQVLSF